MDSTNSLSGSENFNTLSSQLSEQEQTTEYESYHINEEHSSFVVQIPTPSESPANLTNQIQPIHPNVFFYRTPNDFRHYYVKCKEVLYDTIVDLLGHNIQSKDNELIFFYRQQHDGRIYQISCEIVPHFLINHSLNKNFLGIVLQQNTEEQQEQSIFTAEQKENLKYHLKQRLSQYLLTN